MPATGEVPFERYYGSVDATPLFLMLLAAYADRTADLTLVRELWPAATAALAWIDRSVGANGYLSYQRRGLTGLINQGWKDSHDAVSHADGRLAEPPIALCEVQAYVYAARRGFAALARRLGDDAAAERVERQAAALRDAFAKDFWLEELDSYALALDGHGEPCAVVASNSGHCLFAGIADPRHAARVVARLLRHDCSCGWGIRTLSALAARYNPLSYHNGSVWPHDNAIIAAGFSRYGFGGPAAEVLSALFDASRAMEDRRLPELFCGFPRSQRQQPVPYPVACRPQAWAAGTLFLLLEGVFGLSIDAWERRVTLAHANLPAWINWVELRDLRVCDARVDLRITRGRYAAAVEVTGKTGDVEVVMRK
jgi:glycogen debranching enzyme